MSVQCWVRDEELKQFVRERCGVETLTARHRLTKFSMNGDGDLFLTFEPRATRLARARPTGKRR